MQSPADYAGAMDLPNGKALSSEDLKKFLKHHHDGFAKKARRARDKPRNRRIAHPPPPELRR